MLGWLGEVELSHANPCDLQDDEWDSRDKNTINIKNFSGLSQECVGVKSVYVLPSSWGKRKHINKIPRKYQENAGTVPG